MNKSYEPKVINFKPDNLIFLKKDAKENGMSVNQLVRNLCVNYQKKCKNDIKRN